MAVTEVMHILEMHLPLVLERQLILALVAMHLVGL
jgi:hypothetical protein